ncbi:hypothetical protein ACEZCY_17560 [Streptacidiphilus sp. N1-12]|uniref:Uncharacterized protein n=2 Tax=Streptacidiphilus alkalitolerans TaxID=3342712 RepID=A0ABV6VCJ2_9ACTN
MNRRHLTLLSVGVAAFLIAGGGAYALDLSRSTAGSTSANPVLPQIAPAARSSAASTDPAQVPGVVGYLNTGPETVAYLTWQVDASGSFSGTLDTAAVSGTAPSETVVPHVNQSVFGQVSGSTIALQEGGHTDTGTLAGGALTLNVVQQDGTIAPVDFTSATPAQYNAALASLRTTVDSANGQARTAMYTQQSIAQLQKDYAALGNDQSSLVTDVGQIQPDLHTALNDVSGEEVAEGQVVSEAKQGTDVDTVCSDAYTVASDGYTVQSDSYTVSSDLDSVTSDLADLRSALPQLRADLAVVQAADPSYAGDGGGPLPGDVASEMTSAHNVAVAQVAKANAQIDTVNGYVATAQTYAVKAARAGGCSAPDPEPTPIPHLS